MAHVLTIPAYPPESEPVTLAALLTVIGSESAAATWQLVDLECAGAPGPARVLEAASDNGRPVADEELRAAANAGVQVIEGELRGAVQGRDLITIRAVDSTWWDIEAEDRLLERFEVFPGAEVEG